MRRASQQRLLKIWERYRKLLRTNRSGDHSGFLLAELERTKSPDERFAIEADLVSEFERKGRHKDAELILGRHVRANPNHPYPLISLAEHFHYYDINRRRALRLIGTAWRRAQKIREFGYQTLGVQARLAIETRNWRLLANTIRSMTKYRHRTGHADVFPETDFIPRIPKGKVSRSVLDAYERRVNYLRGIGYGTLTGRPSRTRKF